MNDNLLNEVFTILGFTNEEKEKLRNDLKELLFYNLITYLVANLPPEKSDSLKELINNGVFDQASIEGWIKNNLNKDNDLNKGVVSVTQSAIEAFFSTLLEDLEPDKKEKIKQLIDRYKNE